MAKSPRGAANGQGNTKPKRQSRPMGPRTLWLLLKPGTDAAAIREQIERVTFNGREVLRDMGTGVTPAVIKYTMHPGKGDSADADDAQVEQPGQENEVQAPSLV